MLPSLLIRRSGVFSIAVAVLLPVVAAAQTSSPPPPVPSPPAALAAVAAAAYHYSPAIRAARQQLRGVQELYPQALAQYQPDITAGAGIASEKLDNSNFGNADGATGKDVGVTLQQPVWRGGRSRAQKNEAKARIRAQKAALSAAEHRTMAEAMTAAVSAQAALRTLAVQQNTEGLYRRVLGDTVKRREGGEATRTDEALAQSRLSGVTADRLQAQDSRFAAERALERHTGRTAAQWNLDGPALVLPPVAAVPDTVEGARAMALAQNPDRSVLLAVIDAENHGVELVRGELLPEVNAHASWSREWDPSPGIIDEATSREVGLRLTVPLYEGGGTRARVRQAKHRMAESRHALDDFDNKLAQDVADALARHQTAQARAGVLAQQGVAARTARDNIEKEIMAGEKTMTDLLQADQTWLDAQVAAIGADAAAAGSAIELMRLLGLLTPAALGFQDEAYDPDAYLRAVRHRVLSTSTQIDE